MRTLKALWSTTTALALLTSGCVGTVPIHDFQYCALIPGGLGAVCDNFLTANQQILDQGQWEALEAQWLQAGQATECTTAQVVGDLKAEIEKLCSVTKCSYAVQQKIKALASQLRKIETTGQTSLTLEVAR